MINFNGRSHIGYVNTSTTRSCCCRKYQYKQTISRQEQRMWPFDSSET